MSLHTLANHLQTAGRGDDSLLVHMTPGEVHGLQSLAMAHGGSLTINPQTGLPEAGFLSGILPMVAGAALAATGVGAPMAALMVGGAGTLATGSLSKGLMMGLGAYGGAGLGAGLGLGAAGAGASALGSAGTIAAQNAANLGAQATSTLGNTMGAGMAGGVGGAAGAASQLPVGLQAATGTGAYAPGAQLSVQPPQSTVFGGMPQASSPVVASGSVNPTTGLPAGAQSVESATMLDRLKSMPGKISDLLTGSGPEADKQREEWLKQNKGYLMAGGLGTLMMSRDDPRAAPKEAAAMQFNPNYHSGTGQYSAGPMSGKSGERNYSFFADGGSVGQQNNMPESQIGQPVEKMSQLNSVGANTNYPMANIHPFGYAVPKNYPVSQNVFQPESYERLDPYTGEQKLAGGGLATLHFKSGGAFISKLAAVKAPTKTAPKLADTKKLEGEIEKLKPYGSYDDQMGKYNDLANQIKDRQADKTNKAKELADRTKSYNADLARMKAEQASRTKDINSEYANKLKDFNAQTAAELKSRQADIKNTKDKNERAQKQADLNNYQKDRNSELANINKDKANALSGVGSDIANLTKDFNNFKNEVGTFNKNIDSQISQASKDQAAAKQAATFAKQRQDKETQFEKVKSSNQSLVDKANADYETGMSKYNEYQNALKDEQAKWEEQTKRQATGISSLRAQSTAAPVSSTGAANQAKIAELEKQMQNINQLSGGGDRTAIQKQIDALKSGTSGAAGTSAGVYTPQYMKDPITGKLVPYQDKASFQKYTKAPGYDTTSRIMDESDVNNLFQDVAGRRPTPEELDKYLGTKTSDAALATEIMKLPDVASKTTFTDEELTDNFKYYTGRDPTKGELANMKKSKLDTFNAVRNYVQSQPAYVDNLNKVGMSLFSQAMETQATTAAQEARGNKPLSADEVATAYKDALGRDPNMDELRKYMGTNALPTDITKELKSSDEYLASLTKPLVPGLQQGAISTSALAAPKYAPGTTLSYTPEQQAAQTGLGSITGGLAPTASGLQQPMNRGAVTIEGAMPLNPTTQEQLGLQTLFGQVANQAPSLQTGLNFAAPSSSTFGFQPYAAPQNPQSIEAILAALKAQQAQAAPTGMAAGGMAEDGYNLGGYSDGGRLLKGPGDGVSDSIPASIGNRQPARLADGEFVVPARIVSELGNGSTDAGARKLYAMMQRIQQARGKTVGNGKVAVNSRAEKLLPA